jgi:hypothetical protein
MKTGAEKSGRITKEEIPGKTLAGFLAYANEDKLTLNFAVPPHFPCCRLIEFHNQTAVSYSGRPIQPRCQTELSTVSSRHINLTPIQCRPVHNIVLNQYDDLK